MHLVEIWKKSMLLNLLLDATQSRCFQMMQCFELCQKSNVLTPNVIWKDKNS